MYQIDYQTRNSLVKPVVSEIIVDLLDWYGEKENRIERDIIGISFWKEDDKCMILLSIHPRYYSKTIDGYLYYEDHLVVFYNVESKCNMGLIDKGGLVLEQPPDKYRDESYQPGVIEAIGHKYQIIDNDSLVLVKQGQLP